MSLRAVLTDAVSNRPLFQLLRVSNLKSFSETCFFPDSEEASNEMADDVDCGAQTGRPLRGESGGRS